MRNPANDIIFLTVFDMNKKTVADRKSSVCVIVPVYNGEKTIKRCLASILRQSYRNIIVVAVDDGSTDRTPEIIACMAKKDSRLISIRQSNAGSISARKAGIRYARDHDIPFLCFCDADDCIPHRGIEKMVEIILLNGVDLVCGNMIKRWRFIVLPKTFKPECLQIDSPVFYSKEDIKNKLVISYFGISNFPVSFAAKLYKTSVIVPFVEEDSLVRFYGEDLSVTLKIMLEIDSICIIPDTVYYYQAGGATGGLVPTMLEDYFNLYRFRLEIIEKNNLKKDCMVYLAIEAMNVLKTYLSRCLEFNNKLRFDPTEFRNTVAKTVALSVFQEASEVVLNSGFKNKMAKLVNEYAVEEITRLIFERYEADRQSIKGKVRRVIRKHS